MHRIYLAGPMTGLPDENRPAFNAEAARLRKLGYQVENPAELNPPGTPRHICMRVDIQALLGCDTIALLPGWIDSSGALLERTRCSSASKSSPPRTSPSPTKSRPTPPWSIDHEQRTT
ncbi:DUF4406 domain-containing protein [Pseudomonas sp. PDM13]|uniref:DUF4406 domain-containing protein n=1 Tax=Pseudomonas sp. PDM13 TaxID=2769255 RepID=UPI0021E0F412|nr:DUF4406 domain-containing protein [Pseudomonas sp. PDM13]MCU9949812.1 DUF4406 domain-containing protein [Pseudomonas sp. PDM13]